MKTNQITTTESATEGLFRTMFDKATDAILLWEYFGGDTGFHIIEANAMACERYGYTREEFLTLNNKDLNTPESFEQMKSAAKLIMKAEQGRYELIHRTKDGTPIPSEVSARRFTMGTRNFIVSIVRDITERKKNEAQIRQLASFPMSNPNPVIRVTPDSQINFANPASDGLLSCWNTKLNSYLPSPWPDLIKTTFETGCTFGYEAACGETTYYLTIYPNKSEGYLNIYGLDISKRKQSERALQENRDYLSNLNNSLPLAVFTVDLPKRIIRYINNKVETIFGFSSKDCLGTTPAFLFPSNYAFQKQQRRIDAAIKKRELSLRTELFFKRKNGEIFPGELTQIFNYLNEETITVVNIVQDITLQKQVQAQSDNYRKELETTVAERTKELKKEIVIRHQAEIKLNKLYKTEKSLRKALEKQISERQLFIHALVHELKTPLTPLITASDYLVHSLSDPVSLSFARNIDMGAKNMERRINELLDMARGEVGSLNLIYTLFDFRLLLQEIADYMLPYANHRKQHFVTNIPDQPLMTYADPDRLRQVITNLLSNSFKFTRQGGHISLNASNEDNGVLVWVEDDGSGISGIDATMLFKPYQRGQTSEGKRLGGLGLGTTLSKMIVELHNGKIWYESNKGRGTTFYFEIPHRVLGKELNNENPDC